MISKRWPYSGTAAATNDVVNEKVSSSIRNGGLLVNSAGAFPPDPLSTDVVVFPNVIQESSALVGASAVSPTAEEEEVAVWVSPAYRTPTRAGNISGRRRSGLRPVRACLIGNAG